jgi:PBP1b-binding outer membrane lipoprotein LpoB
MSRAIAITLAALLLVGCAQLKPDAPYNAQAACEASGGAYSGDGTCHAGLE